MGHNTRRSAVRVGCRVVLLLSPVLLLSLSTCSTKNLLLTERFGSVFVTSTPEGADILLDRGLTGKTTPDTVFGVAVGNHVVRVLHTGYLSSPESLVVNVEEDGTSQAEFVLLETTKGSLKVTSNVDGATICLDNQPTQEVTPRVFFNSIPVGQHIVSVFKEGHLNLDPAKQILEVSTGDTATAHFELAPAATGVDTGDVSPDFDLQDDFGFQQRLYAYRGFVVMINFWAEDCHYCMLELPYLQDIYSEYLADTLIVFGINYEDEFSVIRRIRDENQIEFTLLKGAGTDVKDNFQVSATPVTIILDRSGKISLWWRGFQNPAIADRFRDKLDELFGK